MNEPSDIQYEADGLTGIQTAIMDDSISEEIRFACSLLNERRAKGILEIVKHTPSNQLVSSDVLLASFERRAQRKKVRLIPLCDLGLYREKDEEFGFKTTSLKALTCGSEAMPYLDNDKGIVYKMYPLRQGRHHAKKILLKRDSEGVFQIEHKNANLSETLNKIKILNDSGALISEIVGLSNDANFLITKQPKAQICHDDIIDCNTAITFMRAIQPVLPSLGYPIVITWALGKAWMIGDLKPENIMRDSNHNPTVVDALIGSIPYEATKEILGLSHAVADAKSFRENNLLPFRRNFDDVNNADL